MEFVTIGQNIFIINKYFKLYIKKALKDYDLNRAEAMVLLMLFQKSASKEQWHPAVEGQTEQGNGWLLEDLHYNKSVMSRTVQSLEAKGYVTRRPNPQDGRAQILSVTEKALAMKPQLIAILQQWTAQLLTGIEDPQLLERMMMQLAYNACHGAGGQPAPQKERSASNGKK